MGFSDIFYIYNNVNLIVFHGMTVLVNQGLPIDFWHHDHMNNHPDRSVMCGKNDNHPHQNMTPQISQFWMSVGSVHWLKFIRMFFFPHGDLN